jgi:antitoxin component YwqK of YwqJK toxin-antitoxin module
MKKQIFTLVIFCIFRFGFSFNITLPDTAQNKTGDSCIYKKILYSNGKTMEEGCLKNEKKDGLWKEYEIDGTLKVQWMYANGKKNGEYKSFYPSGKVQAIGYYKNGNVIGKFNTYSETGDLIYESEWVVNKSGYGSTEKWRKIHNKNAKPDGTKEIINGKKYMWMQGEKHLLKQ